MLPFLMQGLYTVGENSSIEWTDHTWNPWIGCTNVSPGCDHCYAENYGHRFGVKWGAGEVRRRTSESNWRQPLSWDKRARREGRRYRVFCASLADVFDNAVDPQWRRDLFDLICVTPHLDWLLLTKRIGNVVGMVDFLPDNLWLGTTVVNQEEADRDIPKLLALPAAIRFLSVEPLLGPIDLTTIYLRRDGKLPTELSQQLGDYVQPLTGNFSDSPKIDWVIVGGESGQHARPMHPDWVVSLHDQCEAASVPFLFKQWGEFLPDQIGPEDARSIRHPIGHVIFNKVGKKAAGRKLFGVTHDGFPPHPSPESLGG